MFVDYWIVIQVQRSGLAVFPGNVIVPRIFPPFVEGTVVAGIKNLVIQSQTETGTRESVRPDFGVFTMATHLAVVPLMCQILSNFRMTPFEGIRTIANDLERLVPLIIS